MMITLHYFDRMSTEKNAIKKVSLAGFVQDFNLGQYQSLLAGKQIQECKSGDLICVKTKSASNKKLSSHEGFCVFEKQSASRCVYRVSLVKKVLHGVQTVINFNILSPNVVSLEVVRPALKVKRARQYERVLDKNKA